MKYKTFHDWILSNLEEGSKILEFGSGPGTAILADKFGMTSIEHDRKYLDLHDTRYIHAPIKNGWYDVEILKDESPKIGEYNLVLVDGPTGKIGRAGLLDHLKLFDLRLKWVFDDVNRPDERAIMIAFAQKAKKRAKIFQGFNRDFAVLE